METLIQAGLSNALSATVLAIVVLSLSRLLRERPAVRHALWLLVLIKLVTPPLYTMPVSLRVLPSEPAPGVVLMRQTDPLAGGATNVNPASFPEEPSSGLPQLDSLDSTWEPMLAWFKPIIGDSPLITIGWIWLTGTLLVLGLSIYRIVGFRRVVQGAEPVTDDVENLVDELAARVGLAHSPSTGWIAGKFSPMVWALPGFRPNLLIPLELWKTLDHAQRSSLVAHELAHLRRGDHHVRLFEIAITALYWWHPLVWLVRRGLRSAEEQCCDAWVVWTFPDFARSYAETLLETLDFLHPSDFAEPLLSSGLGRVDHLRKRLTMIMTGTSSRGMGAGGLFGLAAVASLLLPIHPTWAGRAEDEKQVFVITSDDKGPGSADAERRTVTITSGDTSVGADAITIGVQPLANRYHSDAHGATKPSNIHLRIVTGDTVREIRTDSIDEAIKILEEQKALLSKTVSDKELIGVVHGIESAIKNLKEAKSLEAKTKKLVVEKELAKNKSVELTAKSGTGTFYTIRSADAEPASPEAAAKVAKAAERVEAIAREVESKQRELQKATRELEALTPKTRIFTAVPVNGTGTTKGRPADVHDKIAAEMAAEIKALEKRLDQIKPEVPAGGDPAVMKLDERLSKLRREYAMLPKLVRDEPKVEAKAPTITAAPDQPRIAELEAKLQKLIDEVNSLKKEQKPAPVPLGTINR